MSGIVAGSVSTKWYPEYLFAVFILDLSTVNVWVPVNVTVAVSVSVSAFVLSL